MAPASRKEREPDDIGLEQEALSWLEDSPPESMASNLIGTYKEHGELEHDLEGIVCQLRNYNQ